jgi:hypothetical protein
MNAPAMDGQALGRNSQQQVLKPHHAIPPAPAACAAGETGVDGHGDTYGLKIAPPAIEPEPIGLAAPDLDHLPPVIVETVIDPAADDDDADDASPDGQKSAAGDADSSTADDETEALFRPSTLRDIVLPTAMIAAGMFLAWLEVTRYSLHPAHEIGQMIAAIGLKIVLACALVLGGMYLAAMIGEVIFIGPLWRTIYKLVGIAIGCCAIYGTLSYSQTTESSSAATYAALLGTFASVAAYFVAYKFLMRLNVRDAAICTIITVILTSIANYLAYKLEGAQSGAWF